MRQGIERGEDLDSRTTGHDYSRSVLDFAAKYRDSKDAVPQPAPAPSPIPEKQASGFWGTLFGLIMKVFVRRGNPA